MFPVWQNQETLGKLARYKCFWEHAFSFCQAFTINTKRKPFKTFHLDLVNAIETSMCHNRKVKKKNSSLTFAEYRIFFFVSLT